MSASFNHHRAFSLIELLVVIAVISILMAILLPGLGRAREQAKRVVCATNIRGLGAGAQNYQTEFNRVLPWEGFAEGDRDGERSVGYWGEPTSWFNSMPAYAGQPAYSILLDLDKAGKKPMPRDGSHSLFVCPSAGPPQGSPKDIVEDGYFKMHGQDADGNSTLEKTYWCYGFNTQLDAGLENRHAATRHVYISMAQIPRPNQTVLLAEKTMRMDEFNSSPNTDTSSNIAQSIVSWREFTTRHNNGGNLLFLDNHVEWFTRNYVSMLTSALDYNRYGSILWNPAGAAN